VGKTQADVADAAGMLQGDVSQLERREDVKVSTLRRYVEALGAELHIVVEFPESGHRMRIEL
jgi:transcriptional regulator with XRE-family HTH domain